MVNRMCIVIDSGGANMVKAEEAGGFLGIRYLAQNYPPCVWDALGMGDSVAN